MNFHLLKFILGTLLSFESFFLFVSNSITIRNVYYTYNKLIIKTILFYICIDFHKKITNLICYRFKKNAVDLSRRYHDRPLSPQDTVAYWTQYVLEHDGAHHLKSHAVNTKWYQYFLLDLIVLIIMTLGSLLYIAHYLISIMKIWRISLNYRMILIKISKT